MNCLAFTLPELMVSIGISCLVFAAIAVLSLYTGRTVASLANYVELDQDSRNTLDVMTRDIRQVQQLTNFVKTVSGTNMSYRLDFYDSDNTVLSYSYSSTNQTLTRIKGGGSQVMLHGCVACVFNMWQRNTVPGTFDLVPTTNTDLCKAIDVTWVCTRTVLGSLVNSESVQTARIIIRKQH
ncbi:MAG: hypothetical protein WCO56_14515 [Verrucomicrobiota bacterium]